MERRGRRILVEGLAVVAVLFPIHFFAERPRPTAFSTLLVLLLFFAPLALAAVRLESRRGTLTSQLLGYLAFGVLLGALAGVVGGLENALLHLVTGESLPMRSGLWGGVALLFAFAAGLAYGAMLGLVRAASALCSTQLPETVESLFVSGSPSSRWSAALYSLIPGLGHFAVGRPARGRPFLLAAVVSGLSGLVIGIAGLILLVEGGVPALPLLVLGATLVVLPLVLVVLAALDLLFFRPAKQTAESTR